MKTIELIKKYERCVLKNYTCPSEVWVIGYGYTNRATNEFIKWNKSNSKVLNGLIRRRQEEKELFLKTNYLSNKFYKSVLLVDALK